MFQVIAQRAGLRRWNGRCAMELARWKREKGGRMGRNKGEIGERVGVCGSVCVGWIVFGPSKVYPAYSRRMESKLEHSSSLRSTCPKQTSFVSSWTTASSRASRQPSSAATAGHLFVPPCHWANALFPRNQLICCVPIPPCGCTGSSADPRRLSTPSSVPLSQTRLCCSARGAAKGMRAAKRVRVQKLVHPSICAMLVVASS